ncbi:MAG: MMPL family transporter, partial [Streptosporangiaceae bacterium]
MFVVFRSDPLGAAAIASLHRLQRDLPRLARRAGLGQAQLEYAGQTAIGGEVARLTTDNLKLILLAAFAVEFILLAAYLRALVAPLFLLAGSALVVGASWGLATLVFGGSDGLTFYAPFSAAVLLVALGSDYNVFAVGGIWEEAARRPLIPALRTALPRTTRAITTAGLTLAGSFALVAIIPLGPFRQIAFMMATGLLIDTFLVRSVFTPSIITLLGPAAGWPGHRLRRPSAAKPPRAHHPAALTGPPALSAADPVTPGRSWGRGTAVISDSADNAPSGDDRSAADAAAGGEVPQGSTTPAAEREPAAPARPGPAQP